MRKFLLINITNKIVAMCAGITINKYQYKFDNKTKGEKEFILYKMTKYMKHIYGEKWCVEEQRYKK